MRQSDYDHNVKILFDSFLESKKPIYSREIMLLILKHVEPQTQSVESVTKFVEQLRQTQVKVGSDPVRPSSLLRTLKEARVL